MKRLFVIVLAVFLVIGLMACGKDVPETTGPVDTVPVESTSEPETEATTVPTEPPVPTEPEFVPDYKPGEENTRSSTRPGFCIQQGEWLYYTTDGDNHSNVHAEAVLKFPIGGCAEDVQKVLAEDDFSKISICCDNCNELVMDFKSLLAVLGDWIYIEIDDGHILQARTDGTHLECIWCPEPEDLVKNAYVMFRDQYLYFTEETIRRLDASTTASTFMLKKQDLDTREVVTVGEVDWNLQNFGRGSVVFQSDGSFYACGEYQIVEIKPNDEINAYDYSYSLDGARDGQAGYRFMPGVERSLLFTTNNAAYHPDGLHSINCKEIGNLPSEFVVSKDEYAPKDRDAACLWTAWDSYLLAGSEDITYYDGIVDVNDGYAYNADLKSGLVYYSLADQTVYKINNDVGDYLFWSEDEDLLYYQTHINGDYYLCRAKLDGSGWEDVSWMLVVPSPEESGK